MPAEEPADIGALVAQATTRHDRKQRPKHPTGYEPGAQLGEDGGWLVPAPRPFRAGEVVAPEREPWEDHLRSAGLNPDDVEVVPPVEIRTWDAAIGGGQVQKMVYFKARLIPRQGRSVDPDLLAWILKWRPRKPVVGSADKTVIVPWSDWQVGKGDGDGTDGTVSRILTGFDQTVDYVKSVRPDRVVVAPLGDLLENCSGHYAQQQFRTDRTLRDQENTVRRLAVQGLKVLSDHAPEVLVLPVGGNHGELRQSGQSFTDFSDNFDVGVFDQAHDQLRENGRFDHIRFHIPRSDLTQTLDVHGWVLGLFHGHQCRGSGDKIANWLKAQSLARQPVGDADIALNGHYHKLVVRSLGPRTHIQVPALDGGSEWFANTSGGGDPAGQVVFSVDVDGWDNLRVFRTPRL